MAETCGVLAEVAGGAPCGRGELAEEQADSRSGTSMHAASRLLAATPRTDPCLT
ncbi:MAG TPA: hypothetical protein VGL48_15940 [Acidimicrobiales bacterium]